MMPLRQTMPISVMKPTQWATERVVALQPDAAAIATRARLQAAASSGRLVKQQRHHRADGRQRDVDQHLQRRPPRSQALHRSRKTPSDRTASPEPAAGVGLLLGLELSAVLDAIVARKAGAASLRPAAALPGCRRRRWPGRGPARCTSTTIRRCDVLAVERVRAGRVEHLGHLPSATLRPDGVSIIVVRMIVEVVPRAPRRTRRRGRKSGPRRAPARRPGPCRPFPAAGPRRRAPGRTRPASSRFTVRRTCGISTCGSTCRSTTPGTLAHLRLNVLGRGRAVRASRGRRA